jgi:hypothetical protein
MGRSRVSPSKSIRGSDVIGRTQSPPAQGARTLAVAACLAVIAGTRDVKAWALCRPIRREDPRGGCILNGGVSGLDALKGPSRNDCCARQSGDSSNKYSKPSSKNSSQKWRLWILCESGHRLLLPLEEAPSGILRKPASRLPARGTAWPLRNMIAKRLVWMIHIIVFTSTDISTGRKPHLFSPPPKGESEKGDSGEIVTSK